MIYAWGLLYILPTERVRVTVRVRPFSKHEQQKEREKGRGNRDKENQVPVVYVKPEKCTVTVRRKQACFTL